MTILPAFAAAIGNLGVRVVGAGDIDQIDIVALNQCAPIGFDRLVAPVLGESL